MSVLVRDHLDLLNRRMEHLEAPEILEWAFNGSGRRSIALSSAFQAAGTAVIHMAVQIEPDVPILFLDTGFHFPETLAFKRRLTEDLDLNVIDLTGEYSVRDDQRPGARSEEPDCQKCCTLNKTIPLRRALADVDGWIASLRRDSSPTRSRAPILQGTRIEERTLLKVNPIATWSRERVWSYLESNRLPHNPLYDRGYSSIGCAPCTRPTASGEDERAGRWPGLSKTECGIHLDETGSEGC